ncbi:ROK family transcriptional regulator [Pontivivens insulae]|uniref:N-acetylglucosamine repressor n=1 Tax=Pontivivens insulae TaxID=1639689 RepID=A0A2R8AFP4_9RHOB|nr:ROK family transcriptional regulator [Pontivivens insulae]RED12152.1 putative NBD/HSP70 family sugar kinase [Pontivivens insulae]SPF30908.1 N-acetylglucosamine repressor [Pontivivens insulae]
MVGNEVTGYGPAGVSQSASEGSARDLIFARIRAAGEIARVDIARDLGISPATVTTLTAAMMNEGLIEETHDTPNNGKARGRPRVSLRLCADAHVVAGLKLGDKVTSLVILDFQGRILAESFMRTRLDPADPDALIYHVRATLTDGLNKAGLVMEDLSAIGIGVPGFVDASRGVVHWCPLLPERNVAVGPALTAALGRPVFIDNDVNLLAMAELWFGVGRTMRDFLVVTIEQGVGMGIVINNRLYRGTRGRGVEFGHMKIQPEGALCRCGQRGCLEAYVADYALLREAGTALPHAPDNPSERLEQLFAEAKAGNMAARSIFRRAARQFSIGLANICNIFDPELVILSGEQMRYDYLYSGDVQAEMAANSLDLGGEPVEFRVHKWEDQLWAKGAGAYALDRLSDQIMARGSVDA